MVRNEKTIEVLKIALAHINSVNYPVSLRWVFYRLLQEGIYSRKKDYNNLKSITAKVRKNFELGWKPDTLADETRSIIWRGGGYSNKEEWIEDLECNLSKFKNQEQILLIMFEAKAMTGQFEHYTKNIPLIACGGSPSIPYKWEIAKAIEVLVKEYKKPVKVLYFGDCDEKGEEISETALKDIKEWCSVDFDFEVGGLTIEQAKQYKLPKNPDKPNQYQWEALNDEQAKAIINPYVERYQDESKIEEIEMEEQKILEEVKEVLLE